MQQIIRKDLEQGVHNSVATRFPPEPNGYLHIGHAKSIFLNFGLAKDYDGICHLRFDDTNPEKENQEYVDSIKSNVSWLGFSWEQNKTSHLYFASNYFDFMYQAAESLIQSGHAYVDKQTPDEIRGRVAAVNSIFIGASNQLGEFESGAVAALWGPVVSVVSGGVGTILVAASWIKLFPTLARRDRMQ